MARHPQITMSALQGPTMDDYRSTYWSAGYTFSACGDCRLTLRRTDLGEGEPYPGIMGDGHGGSAGQGGAAEVLEGRGDQPSVQLQGAGRAIRPDDQG